MAFQLATNALTTTDAAKAWLRRSNVADPDDDDLITLAINGVSSHIIKFTGRQFAPETGATKTFLYTGNGYLSLAPYEARAITSVTLGGQALALATGNGSGDYLPQPRNKTQEGTWLSLTVRGYVRAYPDNDLYASVLNERDVVIVGDWGMAAVPGDVVLACLIGVADFFRNPEDASSRGDGAFAMTEIDRNPGSDSALPPAAIDLVAPYIRPRVG